MLGVKNGKAKGEARGYDSGNLLFRSISPLRHLPYGEGWRKGFVEKAADGLIGVSPRYGSQPFCGESRGVEPRSQDAGWPAWGQGQACRLPPRLVRNLQSCAYTRSAKIPKTASPLPGGRSPQAAGRVSSVRVCPARFRPLPPGCGSGFAHGVGQASRRHLLLERRKVGLQSDKQVFSCRPARLQLFGCPVSNRRHGVSNCEESLSYGTHLSFVFSKSVFFRFYGAKVSGLCATYCRTSENFLKIARKKLFS